MNLIAYILYFALMGFIIGRVGWLFYHHGQVYVDRLFPSDLAFGNWINKLLLKGYYLFNLGYVAISIQSWTDIGSLQELIERVSSEVGIIILLLALMHYVNLTWLQLYGDWREKQKEINSHKSIIKSRNHGSK